jgi:hypothetical protein
MGGTANGFVALWVGKYVCRRILEAHDKLVEKTSFKNRTRRERVRV